MRYRLGLAMTALIGLSCTALYLYVPARLHHTYMMGLREQAGTIARMTAYSAAPAVLFGDSLGVVEAIASATFDGDLVGIVIADDAGRIINEFWADRPGSIVVGTAPLEHLDRRMGSVTVSLSSANADRARAEGRARFTLLMLVFFAISAGFAFVLSALITGPVSAVTAAASAIARGGAMRKVSVPTGGETGDLADGFNLMIDRLEAAQSELRSINATLEQRVSIRTAELEAEVAERRNVEQLLRASEHLFRAIFEAAPIGIALLRPAGDLRDANPALLAMLSAGAARSDGVFLETLTADSRSELLCELQRIAAGSAAGATLELELAASNGTLQTVCTLAPLRQADASLHVLALLEDVTNERALEQEFRQAQKLEAVGRLAGGIAHDFNNLLTTINGLGDLLQQQEHAPDVRRDLEQIRTAGERAAQLTRQLLAFSRRQVLQPQAIDINDVVIEVTQMLERTIGAHIVIATDLSPAPAIVRADRAQLLQVILNLAINARDAMPEGGSIRIGTRTIVIDEEGRLHHGLSATGAHVVLSVEDTGCGMDEDVRTHAFEPFFTTKPLGEGTGLGLATVYGIVRQSGGAITVDSAPGRGTTFDIFLPRDNDVVAMPQSVVSERTPVQGGETVLVVEDEDTVRKLLVRVLSSAGYMVLAAPDGRQAIDLATEHQGDIALVLTDVVMPVMGGPELVREMRLIRPSARFVMMSGYAADAVQEPEALGNVSAFLGKPMTPAALVSTVRNVLDGQVDERAVTVAA
jgi:signal transduction histidine kinase/ActR/RegA family two-component response regulator